MEELTHNTEIADKRELNSAIEEVSLDFLKKDISLMSGFPIRQDLLLEGEKDFHIQEEMKEEIKEYLKDTLEQNKIFSAPYLMTGVVYGDNVDIKSFKVIGKEKKEEKEWDDSTNLIVTGHIIPKENTSLIKKQDSSKEELDWKPTAQDLYQLLYIKKLIEESGYHNIDTMMSLLIPNGDLYFIYWQGDSIRKTKVAL